MTDKSFTSALTVLFAIAGLSCSQVLPPGSDGGGAEGKPDHGGEDEGDEAGEDGEGEPSSGAKHDAGVRTKTTNRGGADAAHAGAGQDDHARDAAVAHASEPSDAPHALEPTAEPHGGALLPASDLDALGPYAVVIEQNAGPNRGLIARPAELGKGGTRHPVFSWGCGAGAPPAQYRDHLTRWASHGFVVEAHASLGGARDHTAVLDWAETENARVDGPYYQKLDTSKVAAGGHALGSMAAFAAGSDARLTTTIHVAGPSLDGNGSHNLKKPAAYIVGASDQFGGVAGLSRDFERSEVPAFFTVMDGVDHAQAARQGLAPIVGWLRWHLAGERDRQALFVGDGCAFCSGRYKSTSKGF